MSIKDAIVTVKELLYVSSKDDISKRYLSTHNSNYQYILGCIDKMKFDSSLLLNEDIVQEFSFSDSWTSGEGDTECSMNKFSFSNLSIGSSNIRDIHDFDLKVISKLAVLEMLTRSNFGIDLYKDVYQTDEVPLEKHYKQLDLSTILRRDKEFSGLEIKTPFVLAMIVQKIRIHGLKIEGIFRKSVSEAGLKNLHRELMKLLSVDENKIEKVYHLLYDVEAEMLAAVLKVFLRHLGFIIPTNIVKFLLGIPDIVEPTTTVLFYQCLVLQLSEPKRILLEIVIDLLADIVRNQESNKISLYNAAALFAPVLFSVDDHSANSLVIRVLQQMIHYSPLIFLVPRNVIQNYKSDNEINGIKFQAMNCIGKKLYLQDCDKAVVLSNFKHSYDGDTLQDQTNDPKSKKNTVAFKYKKQTKTFSYDDLSTVADLLKTADDSGVAPQLRLVENRGNLYQCSLHPDTRIHMAVEGNLGGNFTALPLPDTDIVSATTQELSAYIASLR